jgi:transposase
MRTRRSFSPEFKREVVSLVLDQGYKVSDVCGQFDLGENLLRRWIKQVRFERDGGVPEAGALTAEQREIQTLKKQIRQLEREKSILKKATALLVSDEIDPTR